MSYKNILPLQTAFSCQGRRGKRSSLLIAGTFALLASVKSMAAANEAEIATQRIGSGNPIVGKEKSGEGRCQECHGGDGNSIDAKIPNHAGQYAAYLAKQLSDFQSGARKHEIMTIMAEDLSAADMADIGAYYANQKIMQSDGGNNQSGRNLFVNGDQARGITACAGCHGENGKGRIAGNVIYPVIGGQRKVYLRSQLVNWKLGERKNSPDSVMNKVAQLLSDDEIEALADYISGL
jgi:cytochrome c553